MIIILECTNQVTNFNNNYYNFALKIIMVLLDKGVALRQKAE